MKKVLILSGSPRKGGNSDTLCDEFTKGAIEAGNEVEKYSLQERISAIVKVAMLAKTQVFVRLKTIWQKFCKKCLMQT